MEARKRLVIGITGRRLSGKTTVAEYLRKRYGFFVLGFTEDLLRPILMKRKGPVNRRSLIELGQEIRKRGGRDALAKLLCRKILPGKNYAIAGIRFPEEVRYLRKRFRRCFILLSVEASAGTRFRRAKSNARFKEAARGSRISRKEFLEIEKLPTERIIPRAIRMADFRVNSDGSKRVLERDVDRVMEKIMAG